MDDDGSSGLLVRSWPARPPSFKKDDEVIVFDKRNPTKVEGHAVVREISGVTVKVRMLDGKKLFVDARRLKKINTPRPEPEAVPATPDLVLVLPDRPEIGGPDSETYRDKVREVMRRARAKREDGSTPKGRFIDPRRIMETVQDAGGPFVGKTKMESVLTSMSEEMGVVPVDADVRGVHLTLFMISGSTLEEATSDWSDVGDIGDIEITSPTSFKILTDVESRMRLTALRRELTARSESVETESFAAFCRSVEALASSMETVTTTAVFDRLPKDDLEKDDEDGKFRKKIAAALKENGFLPQTSVVDGKKVKVFVRPKPEVKTSFLEASEARKKASREWEAREEKLRMERDRLDHEMLTEEKRADREDDDKDMADAGEELATLETEGVSPDRVPERAPEDLSLLPGDWKEKVAFFLQGAGYNRTYISLDGVILEAFDRVPQEIRVMDRGRLSQYLMSMGLVSIKYDNHGDSKSERKMFHVEGNPPSDDEMREHFEGLDANIVRRLDIRVSDAPSWMTEEQRVELSYLEHAVLLLCEDRPHNRIGLFPGHPNPDWQRKVLSVLIDGGLVIPHGGGWSATYSGVRPSIEQALERDFLLRTFWRKKAEKELHPVQEQEQEEEEEQEPQEEQEREPQEEQETTVQELTIMVKDMFEALKNHAEEIRKLRRRIKKLEGGKVEEDA